VGIVRFDEHHGPVRPNGTYRAAMRDPQMGSSSSAYRLWSQGVDATPVGECGVSHWRWLLCRGSLRLRLSRFGIGGRRASRTGRLVVIWDGQLRRLERLSSLGVGCDLLLEDVRLVI